MIRVGVDVHGGEVWENLLFIETLENATHGLLSSRSKATCFWASAIKNSHGFLCCCLIYLSITTFSTLWLTVPWQ